MRSFLRESSVSCAVSFDCKSISDSDTSIERVASLLMGDILSNEDMVGFDLRNGRSKWKGISKRNCLFMLAVLLIPLL